MNLFSLVTTIEKFIENLGAKMRSFCLMFLLMVSIPLSAQDNSFEINFGVNRSWFIYEVDLLNDYETDFVLKPTISLHYNFANYSNFMTSVGLRYYNLGRSVTVDIYGRDRKETLRVDHYLLSLPLQVKYNFRPINTDLILNMEPSFILKSKSNSLSPMSAYVSERTVTSEMNKFQFLIGGGLEYSFTLLDQRFGLKTLLNYCLTKIPKEGTFKDLFGQAFSYLSYHSEEIIFLITYHF